MTQLSRGQAHVAKRKLKGAEFFLLIFFAFLLAIPMVWIASIRTDLVRYGYQMVELKTEEAHLLEEQAYLRGELARISSPDRVFREMKRMGFVPGQERIVVYQSNETLVAEVVAP
ncbi:MAG: hypothetical protein KDC35_04900 [Acidobacteria bacterium]|nr:hypothetical protein [Acidobacteriota bacterium]